jgi:hypothetical protein
MKYKNSNKGFIGTIIIVVIALAVSKYFFNFNVIEFFTSPKVTEVFNYIRKFLEIVWTKYIGGSFWYIWNNIVVDVIWKTFKGLFVVLKSWVDIQK